MEEDEQMTARLRQDPKLPFTDEQAAQALAGARNRAREHANPKDEYETPRRIFDPLNYEFRFGIDLAASKKNRLCGSWFGPGHDDGKYNDSLSIDWNGVAAALWLNPPYGKGIDRWVRKAYEESAKGALVVALLPANMDSGWMHDWVLGKAELRFIRGRVQFTLDGKRPQVWSEKRGKMVDSGNTGGNVIAIYRPFGRGV